MLKEYRQKTLVYYRFAEGLDKKISNSLLNQNKEIKVIPIRLSLALNFSVFMYELMHEKKKGLRKLSKGITNALEDFEKWDKEKTHEINKLLDLMNENLKRWKEETEIDSDEDN